MSSPEAQHEHGLAARVRALADRWDAERYPRTGDPGWNQGYDTRRESSIDELRALLVGEPNVDAFVQAFIDLYESIDGVTSELSARDYRLVNEFWPKYEAAKEYLAGSTPTPEEGDTHG